MGSSLHQNVVDGLYAVLRCCNFSQVYWLHNARRCQQERAVGDSSCSWDDLSGTAENWLICKVSTQELELAALHLLLTQRSLASCPLESVNDRSLHNVQLLFVNLTLNSVVNQHI